MKRDDTMKKKTLWEKASVGFYEPIKVKQKIRWNVKLSKNSGFLCERQEDAQIMSMLVRLMQKLGIDEDKDFIKSG